MLRSNNAVPDSGGTPATLIVTIDLEDLLAKTGYALTSDGTLIKTGTALAAADQADIYWAIKHSTGQILHLGRTRRIASLPQTIALYARDRGCSFPGCDIPPEWCERHHILAWTKGGLTDLNNLTLFCSYHHHNFLLKGWECRINRARPPRMAPTLVDRPQPHPHDQQSDPRRPRHRTPTTLNLSLTGGSLSSLPAAAGPSRRTRARDTVRPLQRRTPAGSARSRRRTPPAAGARRPGCASR